MDEQTRVHVSAGGPSGDLGRRLVARRTELGLTAEEVATRAGMAPTYLAHLEKHSGTAPSRDVLLTLAAVLETTASALTGGDVDLPPGSAQAGRAPRFTHLSSAECADLMARHGVGRLAVSTSEGPAIVPVNYSVIDTAIVFRTAEGATPSLAAGSQVAFEVDRIDDAFSQGWSVLVRGRARTVTDPAETRLLAEEAYSAPWAGGRRDVWVRIEPQSVTGRRIAV
ncbi:helix-turn-helix domain-containing protein [Streptomyces sp. NPDC091209]|uniref:helix-turn-helix domain-containing protein n=1 Tax=Streptomyces sp. NPDC091209 TaxID=3365974 RepID=UPI00382B8C75